MSFDLATALKEGQAVLKQKQLGAILLGSSGSGKSRACGTMGVKTLYLYTSGEQHGALSASSGGSEILPICVDQEGGKALDPDAAYSRLLAIINDGEAISKAGIKAVVIDGLTEIESMILETKAWKQRVQVEYKGVASYAGPVTLSLMRPILTGLQKLQKDHGIHFVVTCILNVKELGEHGEIMSAEPKLKGFDVATDMVRQFADVLIIGQMSNGEVSKPRIQIGAHVSKASKDFKTLEVRKLQNFHVRVTGCDLSGAPDTLAPNLAKIAEYKASGKYVE
jgi:hypothetical protein